MIHGSSFLRRVAIGGIATGLSLGVLAAATPVSASAATQRPTTSNVIEPINTQEYYSAEGCFAVYEFGNYDGVAFGKSEVADVSGSGCEIADYIVAYKNGSYAYGYSAAALAGEGWTNPQAQVTGYSVLSEYVEVCSKKGSTLACQLNEFDAL